MPRVNARIRQSGVVDMVKAESPAGKKFSRVRSIQTARASPPAPPASGSEEPWYGEANKALARKVTQESIVLLKNADGLLPLDKSKLRSIAVIGPYGDNVLVDWYAGMPPYT